MTIMNQHWRMYLNKTNHKTHRCKTEWGHSGYCYRKMMNFGNHKAKLNFHADATKKDFYLQLFEGLFPTTLLYTMVDGVNETMKGE